MQWVSELQARARFVQSAAASARGRALRRGPVAEPRAAEPGAGAGRPPTRWARRPRCSTSRECSGRRGPRRTCRSTSRWGPTTAAAPSSGTWSATTSSPTAASSTTDLVQRLLQAQDKMRAPGPGQRWTRCAARRRRLYLELA
ncbi:hypothetical protein BS78_07G057300 [Paspalum vaginatum]|nr:hypothetical protein BS78_07G057300 [Paspalum vaginatum]